MCVFHGFTPYQRSRRQARTYSRHQLAGDQAGLDRLPQAGVIGDEQVHPRQEEHLAERLELVGQHLDAGAPGSLEEPRVRGRENTTLALVPRLGTPDDFQKGGMLADG